MATPKGRSRPWRRLQVVWNLPLPDLAGAWRPTSDVVARLYGTEYRRTIVVAVAEHRITIEILAPPDRVFALWMDLGRMTEWVGGVTRVTDVTGPIDVAGTRYTVWFGPMKSPTEILAVDRPHHVRTRFGNLILKGESDVRFEPTLDGTRLTQVFRTRGIISAITGRLFATGSYEGSFKGELEQFRSIVEREAPNGHPVKR